MTKTIILSEYSVHTSPKKFIWNNGLNYFFIRLQTEGQCSAIVNNKKHNLVAGDLLMCQPGDNCEITVSAFSNGDISQSNLSGDFYIMCQADWLINWWSLNSRHTIQAVTNKEQLLVIWKEIINERHRILDRNEDLLECLLKSLCLMIDKNYLKQYKMNDSINPAALRMKSFIEEHAIESVKVEEVAKFVGFSPSYASQIFKQNFNRTIIQYTIEIRLNIAENLIKYSNMPLEHIAYLSGFKSYSYFYRVFKKTYNTTPKKYFEAENRNL